MPKNHFEPMHINASPEDMGGNNGIGRYILLPGSDGRAQEIARHFTSMVVKPHYRAHNLYLGTLLCDGKKIDVATVSSGMGCPSAEIIVHELFHLGARRFLRIGTAGSLQPDFVKVGDIVNVQASVRDEGTTQDYVPLEFPAVASLEMASSTLLAAERLGLSDRIHTGVVHCKNSLYAREFGAGPRHEQNKAYLDFLTKTGVLASEMETATLFIQSQLYNYQLRKEGSGPSHQVLSGAILGIISNTKTFDKTSKSKSAVDDNIALGLETIKTLAMQELLD
ncbi:MAG: nucleoside phosphorylase [Gammaproteobacteria bacterium]|nr:nucleoside phosphorylase [Gammaproteobacteria bacterium]